MRALVAFFRGVKAPWVFALVALTTAVACYITIHDGLLIPKAAFQFSAVLIGGFIAKALLATMIGAYRTMFLMVASSLLLVVISLNFTDAGVFKDAAVEGLLVGIGGGIIVVIGALLERHKD